MGKTSMGQVCVNKKVEDERGQSQRTQLPNQTKVDYFGKMIQPNLVKYVRGSHDTNNNECFLAMTVGRDCRQESKISLM